MSYVIYTEVIIMQSTYKCYVSSDRHLLATALVQSMGVVIHSDITLKHD